MREVFFGLVLLHLTILMIQHDLPRCLSSPTGNIISSDSTTKGYYTSSAHISSRRDLQSLSTAQAPSPLMPFTYKSFPSLSGQCVFNFSSAESILKVTAIDCWSSLAPYLANAVCCPQYEASLVILLGQTSSHTGMLALNETHASHCIRDVDKILESQGASKNLQQICSTAPGNLTGASCPVIDANEVDSILAPTGLVATFDQFDTADECCNRIRQNAVSAAAAKLAWRNYSPTNLSGGNPIFPKDSVILSDCTNVVLRWLSSKLHPAKANIVLRGLSSCKINEACPLVFPDIHGISKECQIQMKNQTYCCDAMESYMSHLQEQCFITTSQALNCASLLSMKLQRVNISSNLYKLCHKDLKDFSIQATEYALSLTVDPKESGCLLPSLPSDVTFDESSGIGFICELKDNVAAPWSSADFVSTSSCNKSSSYAVIPELPEAKSNQRALDISNLMLTTLFSISLII